MNPADHTCAACGQDWGAEDATHWGLDVRLRAGAGDCWAALQPCCQAQADAVQRWGYADAYGRTVAAVVAEIVQREVLEVTADGQGAVVCRLQVYNPTAAAARADGLGRRKASSRPGWQREVFAQVDQHHRHHPAPQGWKFGVAVHNGAARVGVATVGRPVSRVLQQRFPRMLEVTRVCTWGQSALRKNAASKLYAAAAAQARALGYDRLITYTLHGEERGDSLLASGWVCTGVSDGGSWQCDARPGASTAAPTGAKVRWERGLSKSARRVVLRAQIPAPAVHDPLDDYHPHLAALLRACAA